MEMVRENTVHDRSEYNMFLLDILQGFSNIVNFEVITFVKLHATSDFQ